MNAIKVRDLYLGSGRPKICVPVTVEDEQALEDMSASLAASCADLFELRADACREDPVRLLKLLRAAAGERPILFTIRTVQEGGAGDMGDEEYMRLNLEAARKGADLVDLEYIRFREMGGKGIALLSQLKEAGAAVIGSFHDFQKSAPAYEITARLTAMQEAGFSLTKIALMPRSPEDVLELMKASLLMKEGLADRPYITISMGDMGRITRCAGSFTGSALSFGSEGKGSAPGHEGDLCQ